MRKTDFYKSFLVWLVSLFLLVTVWLQTQTVEAQPTFVWSVTINPTGNPDYLYDIAADESGVYVVGTKATGDPANPNSATTLQNKVF